VRLVSSRDDGANRCGLVAGGAVVDVQSALTALGESCPDPGVRAFLERPDWRAEAARILAAGADDRRPLGESSLAAAVPDPRKIFVVGANTRSHLAEAAEITQNTAPIRPMLLAKTPNTIIGPHDPIPYPAETDQLDYEAELVVIVGRRARRVAEADVDHVIAGYTVGNDVSARDLQLSSWEANSFYRTHFLGKSCDGFCPLGGFIVTSDEVPDLAERRIRTTVNDELRQDSTLDDLYFSVPQLVSYISQTITLEPGDVILTGSPAGVAHFRGPSAYLRPGDVVRCEIDGIDATVNRVVPE
jgi:2-keto-4-pentenoate hydratase/2-oxohepta-3-ene-1,7-dioic acid hydratase in catechol pathway